MCSNMRPTVFPDGLFRSEYAIISDRPFAEDWEELVCSIFWNVSLISRCRLINKFKMWIEFEKMRTVKMSIRSETSNAQKYVDCGGSIFLEKIPTGTPSLFWILWTASVAYCLLVSLKVMGNGKGKGTFRLRDWGARSYPASISSKGTVRVKLPR